MAHGVDQSLLGGLQDDVTLHFRRPGTGSDPGASVAFAAWAFFWAVGSGQFDDLDTPAMRILMDDDRAPKDSDE